MKVLHLPFNMASQLSVTVRAQRDLGIDARGLVVGHSKLQDARGVEIGRDLHRGYWANRASKVQWWYKVLRAMLWADVIHWHYARTTLRNDFDLQWPAALRKPRFVEFWGSDIRIPTVAANGNPYIEQLYAHDATLSSESEDGSLQAQKLFARYGFSAIIPGVELASYVQSNLFPHVYRTQQRLFLSEFEPAFPDPMKQRLLLVHVPSSKAIKGTDAVLQTVEILRQRHEFDFTLIHDVAHSEAINLMRQADIVLDQFVIGDHGLATLEAMALGKPTVCYIKDAHLPQYPVDFPIVNAHQNNLVQTVEALLIDGQRRHTIGRNSRKYVERHHDAHVIAKQLFDIYLKHIKSPANVPNVSRTSKPYEHRNTR